MLKNKELQGRVKKNVIGSQSEKTDGPSGKEREGEKKLSPLLDQRKKVSLEGAFFQVRDRIKHVRQVEW